MKLTYDQERAFENWIRQKVEHHTCQLCQSSHWRIGEMLTYDQNYERASASMVQMVCQNCGHVLLFDASFVKELRAADANLDLM